MERLANPLISLYALSTEWGFSSCRHQEPILDGNGCQRGERGEDDGGKWTRRDGILTFDYIQGTMDGNEVDEQLGEVQQRGEMRGDRRV